MPPLSITFSRGKTRLLYINLHCYARTSGAAARHAPYGALYGYCIKTFQFLFLSSFSAPNIYILFRVDKLMDNVSERNGVSDNANRVRQLAGGGVPPLSITFSRGKTRLLYINLHCYARTSGAAAVRFTAIVSKFTSSFFYQTLPHLMQSLCRAA